MVHVSGNVGKLTLQTEGFENGDQRLAQAVFGRVVGVVRGPTLEFVVFEVLGTHRRAHKDKVVVKVRAVQDLGGDRVEECLGQLGLVVVYQEPDVVQLDFVPQLHRLFASSKLLLQPAHAFFHPQVIELNALALGALLVVPVCRLEPVLGTGRLGAKQPVVAVKAIAHRLGDVVCIRRFKALWKHGDRSRRWHRADSARRRRAPF